jgi:hypothetical protein
MTVLRHSVSVLALSPERLQELTGLVVGLAESTRARGEEVLLGEGLPVEGLRLVEGRHLRRGARYELESGADDRLEVLVREWRRAGAIAVESTLTSDDMTMWTALRLRTPDRPRLLDAEGRVHGGEGTGKLRRGSGRVRLDLAAWWEAVGPPAKASRAGRAPATARLKHVLGEARLHLRPRQADEGRWQVDVTVTLRGRWLLRPVAALALMMAGRRVRQGFRSSVDQAADAWNQALSRLSALSPDELRAHLTIEAAERRQKEPGTPAG